jgi:hypothetical protein
MYFIYLHEIEQKKPLGIALSWEGWGLRGKDDGSNLTDVQYRPNWNCHYDFPHTQCIYPN